MGQIICLMGKSSSGKDTIFRRIMSDDDMGLKHIVPYTTRPIRTGEQEGMEYHFTDEAGFQSLKSSGKIIEDRAYDTVQGVWRYFTVNDGQFDDTDSDYGVIGTLAVYEKFLEFFGPERVVPILIEVEDGLRLKRALEREMEQANPKYAEMCRRFLADCDDFSEEKIAKAGITKHFVNNDLEECLYEIKQYIQAALDERK